MTEKPPERVGSVSLQLLQPRYGDRSRPFFRRDKPTEASKQWLDTKVNFLNEMMKFIPRNMADALSSHSYSKETVKNIDKSNLRAESAFNAQFIKDSGDLWKGTQSVTASKIFNDTSGGQNLSQFTGMLGTPYDGQIGAGAKIIGTDGTEEIRPVFVSATDQDGNEAYGLYYKDEKGKRWPVGSAPIVPMPKGIQGDEFGRYFGEGVDFHPTVVDMRHTLLKSQVDINGDGIGETDLTTTALTTTDYADKYLKDMGVFSPVLDYSESFKNFMSGSELGTYVKPTAYTYNKLGSQGSGDFSGLLEKIRFTSAQGLAGYVPNIYELARSGFDVTTLSDKEVLQLSMLMLEARRRFTYGMSTVFGTKKDQVDMTNLVSKYTNSGVWNGNDGQYYTTVTTSTGKTEKVYNYFIPEGKNLNFLKERAAEVQTWRAAKDLYTIGMQSGACNNPELKLIKETDTTIGGAGITELIALRGKIQSLTNNELQPKLIHVLMQKITEVKDALVSPDAFAATSLPKLETEDFIKIINTTGFSSPDYDRYVLFNKLQVAEAKIMKGAGAFLRDNSDLTSPDGTTQSLMGLYLNTRYPDTFGMTDVSSKARLVVKNLATKGYEDVEGLKTLLADPATGMLEPLSDGSDYKRSGDLLLTLLEQGVEKKMRIFHDLSSTDEFNQLMYGVIPGTDIGYMPASIAKSTAASPFLTKSKRPTGTDVNATVTSMSSVTDRMYFAMTEKMQKMADFYMMSMFASPHEGDGNDLNFLRSLKDAQSGSIGNAVGMMDSTLEEMMTATDVNGDGHTLTGNTGQVFGILQDSIKADYDKEKVFLTSLHNRLKTISFTGAFVPPSNLMNNQLSSYYFPPTITNTVDFNNKINELKSWLTPVAASPTDAFNVNVSETNMGPLKVNRAAAILGLINNVDLAGSVTQAATLGAAASSVTNSTSGILLYNALFDSNNVMNSFKAPSASVNDLITIRTDSVRLDEIQTSNLAISNLLNSKWKMAVPPAEGAVSNPAYAPFYALTGAASVASNQLKDYLKNIASEEDVLNASPPEFKSYFKEKDSGGLPIPDAVLFNTYIRSLIRTAGSKFNDALNADTGKLVTEFKGSLDRAVKGFVVDATAVPPTLDAGLKNANGTRSVSINHLQTCEGLFKELSPLPTPKPTPPLSKTLTSTLTDSRTTSTVTKTGLSPSTMETKVWVAPAATPLTGYWQTTTVTRTFKEVCVTGQTLKSVLNSTTGEVTETFTNGKTYHFEKVDTTIVSPPASPPPATITLTAAPTAPVITGALLSVPIEPLSTPTNDVPIPYTRVTFAPTDVNNDYFHTLTWPDNSLGLIDIPADLTTTPPTPAIIHGPTTVTIGSHADNRIAITRTGTNTTATLEVLSNATNTNFTDKDKFIDKWAYGRLFDPKENVADSYPVDPFNPARTFDTVDPTMRSTYDPADPTMSKVYDSADPSVVKYYGVGYYNTPTSGQTKFVSMMDDFCRDFAGIQQGKDYTTNPSQQHLYQKLMAGTDSTSLAFQKKWKDQGKPFPFDPNNLTYAPSTYDILMVSKTDLVEFNQLRTALTGQYDKIRQQVNDILSISTLSNVKDLYFNEFYMKGTFQSLIMSSEYKGRYIDGVANTDLMGESRRSGWYETDGQLYSQSKDNTSMDFAAFNYNVDTDLFNLKQDIQTDRTVTTFNNDNIRSKRKRSVSDYFETLSTSGTTVSGTLRSDSTTLNKNTMRVGKVSALVHADIELSSTYQEVLMANMITGMYNDNTKHDEKIQADRDKEQLELYNQEQAEIERSNAVAESNARAARAAWSIRRKR